jgi:hypothetical protein
MKPALLATLVLATAACAEDPTAGALGAPVDVSAVVPVEPALELPPGSEVTLRGEVQSVCASAGCWFTLRRRSGELFRDVHVDLQPAAGFRLDASAVGRTVVVRGRLAGEVDRELHALGLVFE